MRTGLVVHSKVTALVASGTAVQDAAAEAIRRLASSNPYCELTRNAVTAEQFHPRITEAHDWEPSISKVQSLQDAGRSVYSGLGVEVYPDSRIQSGDLSNINFVKASDGPVPMCTASTDETVREVLEE